MPAPSGWSINIGPDMPGSRKREEKKPALDSTYNFILALEMHDCDKKIQEYCVYKKEDNCTGISCPYPMRENPLCLCNNFDDCNKLYRVIKVKEKNYFFYQCDRCNHFVKNFKNAVKSILIPLNSKYLFFDKDLEKLSKEAFKAKDKVEDIDIVVKYLENAFKIIQTNGGG